MKTSPQPNQETRIGRPLGQACLKLIFVAVSILVAVEEPAHAQLRSAFVPTAIDSEPSFFRASTRGWNFGITSTDPIMITHVGIYDVGNDGLASPHEVGVWVYDRNTQSYNLLASATVPSSTSVELIGGYRYVPISPVLVSRGQSTILGATYALQDPDDLLRPVQVTFAPEIGGGYVGLESDYGTGLNRPWHGIARGQEGLPNYPFYHVNFLFQAVPEPQVTGLLILGLGGIFLLKRR